MHEILRSAAATDWVLDLGSQHGSFPPDATSGRVVRLDLEVRSAPGVFAIQADAAHLPFRDGTFARAVANHSFEHFENLDAAVGEFGRVLAPYAQAYVAVPDASTLADRLYRWLARGGGHLNAFVESDDLAGRISRAIALPHAATRLLHSGFTFANRRNAVGRPPRRLWLLGGGFEPSVRWATWTFRQLDRLYGTRLSVYGWAFYFGRVHNVDTTPWPNVCIRCGAGHPSRVLSRARRAYACPQCGVRNMFTPGPPDSC